MWHSMNYLDPCRALALYSMLFCKSVMHKCSNNQTSGKGQKNLGHTATDCATCDMCEARKSCSKIQVQISTPVIKKYSNLKYHSTYMY